MPRVSQVQKEARKNEILDVCEQIYREQGFFGVTIKEISTKTSFTRQTIYTYFETKDEILLGLLTREYMAWIRELKSIEGIRTRLTSEQLAELIAHSLEEREVLLRLQNMNLYEIELNSRVERLADFKEMYKQAVSLLEGILAYQYSDLADEEKENICLTFFSFLFGVYPFVFHTEKQLLAMEMAGVSQSETSIYKMVYECMIRLLPDRKDMEK